MRQFEVDERALYQHWAGAVGKTSSKLIVVPSSKMKEVLNEFRNGASGG